MARAQGGSVVAWGSNLSGKTNVPPSATNVVAISGGGDHSLALRADGVLVGWGSNSFGQTNVPVAATNLAAVSAGGTHSLALRRDATVLAWGNNRYGQTNPPPSAAGAVAIAAASSRSLALHTDGSVVGWGGTGSAATNTPPYAADLTRISAATAVPLSGFCVGLRHDGTVVAWGTSTAYLTNVPPTATNIVAVAAGGNHALALHSGGTVLAWGSGRGTNVPPTATNVVAIAAGDAHGLALRTDGTVIAWGDNASRQTNVPPGLANVIAIDAGGTHGLALVGDGSPHFADSARPILAYTGRPLTLNALAVGVPPLSYQWRLDGTNLDGAIGPTLTLPDVQFTNAGTYSVVVSSPLGVTTGEVATVEVDLPPMPPVITRDPESQTVFAGTNVLFSVEVTGHPLPRFQWRFNGTNIAGATRSNYAIPYVLPTHAGGYSVIASNSSGVATSTVATLTVNLPSWPALTNWPASRVVSLGSPVTVQVAAVGPPPLNYQWRLDGVNLEGATGPSLSFSGIRRADAGVYSVVVTNASGATTSSDFELVAIPVAVWGNGPVTNPPAALSNAVALAAGAQHALALKSDGTVVAWGSSNVVTGHPPGPYVTNNYGQLDVPAGLDRVVAVACGDYHNLALREDGTVTAWGWNSGGQTNVPMQPINVIALAAGSAHSLALRADGTVLAWGTNSAGQVNVPLNATNAIAIAAGDAHSLCLRADGTVVAWGANSSGQCSVPANATNIAAIAAAGGYSVALRGSGTDGRLVRWGNWPSQAQLGEATGRDPYWVEAVAAGPQHTLILRTGYPVTANYSPGLWMGDPRLLSPKWLTRPITIAAGGNFSLALVSDGPPLAPLQPVERVGFVGGTAMFNVQGPGAKRDSYQWRFNGTNLSGATQPFLVLTNLQVPQAGDYTLIASNSFGAVTSRVAHLDVAMPPPPEIIQQPIGLTAPAGANVSFQVATVPGVPVSFQWQFNQTNLVGATSALLWLTNEQATHIGDYRVIAANPSGSITSQVATLSLTSSPPVILLPPQNLTVAPGMSTSFRVTAAGAEPLAYQWQHEGTNLLDATEPVLTLTGAQPLDAGMYQVVITNASGAVTSAPVTLALSPVAAWGGGGFGVPAGESDLLATAAGSTHALALRTDGTLAAWGNNGSGQISVPASATNIMAIAAGPDHSLALRADGAVLAWGGGFNGENQVPAGLSNVIAISTSYRHNLALRAEGSVLAWGDNFFGQCDVPPDLTNAVAVAAGTFGSTALRSDGTVVTWGSSSGSAPPAGLSNVISIAMGLVLKADGTVVGWGSSAATPPAGLSNVVAIAAGGSSFYGLKRDGTVIAWGAGAFELPVGLTNVLAVSVAWSGSYTLALVGPPGPQLGTFSMDRTVPAGSRLVMGSATVGAQPLSYEWQRDGQAVATTAGPFLVLSNAQSPDAGTYFLVVTNACGAVTGQVATLTVAPSAPVIVVQPASQTVALGTSVELSVQVLGSAVVCQWQHAGTNLIDDGRVSGANSSRLRIAGAALADSGDYVVTLSSALGQVTSSPAVLTVLPPTLEEAVDTTGLAWTTGSASTWAWQTSVAHDGQDAAASGPSADSQTNWLETAVVGPITLGFWWKVSSYAYGGYLRFRLDGRELASIAGEIDWQPRSVHVPAGTHTLRREYAKIFSHADGQDRGWVDQVGIVDPDVPAIVTQPTPRSVPAGSSVAFSVVAQGTLPLSYQWQQDGADIEGATNTTVSLTNVQSSASYSVIVPNAGGATNSAIANLTVVDSAPTISAQPSAQTAALSGDATFTCVAQGSQPLSFQWQFEGENIPGATRSTLTLRNVQPGHVGLYRVLVNNALGTTFSAEASLTLVPVAAWGSSSRRQTSVPAEVGDVVGIAAGREFSLALRRDGSVAFWGGYSSPSASNAYVPSGLVAISAASWHSVGLRADGTVVAWGLTGYQVPVEATNVIAVGAGSEHNLALRNDGTVVAWGNNDRGQAAVPPNTSHMVAIAGGGNHSLGLRDDGCILAWGTNDFGQLEVPLDLTNAVTVAAGLNHNLALCDDGTVVAWGDNEHGQTNVPPGLMNVVAIAAGEEHSLALREDGTVAAWGSDLSYQADPPASLTNVVGVAGGENHSLALVGDGQPVVTVQPFSRHAYLRGTTRLRAMAVGTGPLAYQWWRESTLLDGETNATLVLADLSAAHTGRYHCVINNSRGQTETREAEVRVVTPPQEFDLAGTFPAADGFHLRLTGLLGEGEIVIYSTPDLMTWEPIHTNSPVVGVFECVDRAATNGAQSYRASEVRTP